MSETLNEYRMFFSGVIWIYPVRCHYSANVCKCSQATKQTGDGETPINRIAE